MGTNGDLIRRELDLIDDETGGDEVQQAFEHRLRCPGGGRRSRSVWLRDDAHACTTKAGEPKVGQASIGVDTTESGRTIIITASTVEFRVKAWGGTRPGSDRGGLVAVLKGATVHREQDLARARTQPARSRCSMLGAKARSRGSVRIPYFPFARAQISLLAVAVPVRVTVILEVGRFSVRALLLRFPHPRIVAMSRAARDGAGVRHCPLRVRRVAVPVPSKDGSRGRSQQSRGKCGSQYAAHRSVSSSGAAEAAS